MAHETKGFLNTGVAHGTFPEHTNNVGVMKAKPTDTSIKGSRSKVDGGITFPKTIRPGSTGSEFGKGK